MKTGKRYLRDGMELPNHDKIKTLEEKKTSKYLSILEVDTIKLVEMNGKIKKEYLKRIRKLPEKKICKSERSSPKTVVKNSRGVNNNNRHQETCCHSDSSEKPFPNADVKSSNE